MNMAKTSTTKNETPKFGKGQKVIWTTGRGEKLEREIVEFHEETEMGFYSCKLWLVKAENGQEFAISEKFLEAK